MRVREYRIGDPVVYRRTKHSTSPGPRAEDIDAAPKGDIYTYKVDKYWIVNNVLPDGTIEIRTRRGKTRNIDQADECLRHASLIERIFKADRFPAPETPKAVT